MDLPASIRASSTRISAHQFNQNQFQTVKKGREKFDLIARSDDLEISIKTLTDVIKGPRTGIAEIQVQLKHAGEHHEKDYKKLQITVADQLDTQQLLTVSLDVLAHFYGGNQPTTKVRVVWTAEIEDDGCWKGLDIEDDGENKRLEEIKAMFSPKSCS